MHLTARRVPGLRRVRRARPDVSGDEVTILAERLLAPVNDADVDTLLLGCTHYPYLARVIGDVMGPDVVLVVSADETAFVARRTARRRRPAARPAPAAPAEHRFLSSGDISWFADLGRRLLGPELRDAVEWRHD